VSNAWTVIVTLVSSVIAWVIVHFIMATWFGASKVKEYDAYAGKIQDLHERLDACETREDVILEIARDSARDIVWLKEAVRKMGGTAPFNGH
jgi:hypothetical protein